VRYAGRDASASPATGLAARHKQQQDALIAQALGLDGATSSPPVKPRKTAPKKPTRKAARS
jgi:2-oxoglutarate dehydrogenase E1 component